MSFKIQHGPGGDSIEPSSDTHGSHLGGDPQCTRKPGCECEECNPDIAGELPTTDAPTPDILRDCQWEIPGIVESLGTVCASMREAVQACEETNYTRMKIRADDAAERLRKLAKKLGSMADELDKYNEE